MKDKTELAKDLAYINQSIKSFYNDARDIERLANELDDMGVNLEKILLSYSANEHNYPYQLECSMKLVQGTAKSLKRLACKNLSLGESVLDEITRGLEETSKFLIEYED